MHNVIQKYVTDSFTIIIKRQVEFNEFQNKYLFNNFKEKN